MDREGVKERAVSGETQIIKICKLFYEQGYSKIEIAEKTRISRFKVAALLEEAIQKKIVTISINAPENSHIELENELERMYCADRIIIADTGEDYEATRENIGRAAADFLLSNIRKNDIVGLAWGTTILHMVDTLKRISETAEETLPTAPLKIVQLTGGLNQVPDGFNPIQLTSLMASALHTPSFQLYAPAIVDSAATKKMLLEESTLKETIALFDKITLAVVGIGSVLPEPSTILYRNGCISGEELSRINTAGAVGDINSHFFNNRGEPCPTPLDERTIGINLEQLKKIPYVVGLAGGSFKTEAIAAALRGKLVNILVTDANTSEQLKALGR
jgi:deoxyribonucleoside regulator